MNLEQLAREAGINYEHEGAYTYLDSDNLERFAALIVESCAKVCDDATVRVGGPDSVIRATKAQCANAIRAMIKEGG